MVVDGLLAFVQVHDLLLLGSDECNVFPGFVAHLLVIDPDIGERVVQQVPKDRRGLAVLGEEQLDILVAGDLLPGAFPFFDEGLGLSHQGGRVLSFGRGADDGPVILGEDAPDKCFESTFLLLGGDLRGDRHFLGKGEKDNVASCKRNFRSQS